MSKRLARTGILIAGIAMAMPAFSAVTAHLPPEHKAGAVTYMSGGIGTDEAEAMKAAEHRYGLALEFLEAAMPRNEYLADIGVKVKDRAGKVVLETRSVGPYLLATLPAGTYTIVADNDGHMLTRTAQIAPDQHKRVVFLWPNETARK
jgi:hypothetical protein